MTTAGQGRNQNPAFRVFMFGQEVTLDVRSVAPVLDDSRAPSGCAITLASPEDRYTITPYDITALYPQVDLDAVRGPDLLPVLGDPTDVGERLDAAADSLARLQAGLLRSILDPVKRRVLQEKIKYLVQVSQPDLTALGTSKSAGAQQLAAMRGYAYRYNMQVGDSIFHSNDPVRVFMRDPADARAWYYAFTGFVTNYSESVSPNNERLVTIECADVLRIFNYARITTNPGIFDISAVQQVEDGIIRTFYNAEGFTNLTLPEVVYTLVFGSDLSGTTSQLRAADGASLAGTRFVHERVSVNGSTTDGVPGDGIGSFDFKRSVTFLFGPDEGVVQEEYPFSNAVRDREVRLTGPNALGIYQAAVDHRVQVWDLETQVLRGRVPWPRENLAQVDGQPAVEDVITVIGEHPELYPVDAGRLVMLLPASLGPSLNRNLLLRDLIQSVALETTFRSRLDLIYDILARIEFSFYATPRGDVVVECPLYDFEPDDFGDEPVTREDVLDAFQDARISATEVGLVSAIDPAREQARGPFAPQYRLTRRDVISWSRSFADEKVRTVAASHWTVVQGYTDIGTSQAIGQPPKVTVLRALVPQFGVRMEASDPTGLIATPEGAQIYTAVKLNQLNADARSMQVDALPRLGIGPNRPILFGPRHCVATLRSVGHSLTWGKDGSATMTLGLNYVRAWDGQLRPGTDRPLYAPLGGFASRPLNYGLIYAPQSAAASSEVPE